MADSHQAASEEFNGLAGNDDLGGLSFDACSYIGGMFNQPHPLEAFRAGMRYALDRLLEVESARSNPHDRGALEAYEQRKADLCMGEPLLLHEWDPGWFAVVCGERFYPEDYSLNDGYWRAYPEDRHRG